MSLAQGVGIVVLIVGVITLRYTLTEGLTALAAVTTVGLALVALGMLIGV